MIFSSLAIMLSSISLYVGSTNVSNTYDFTKEIVDNNYIHCHFVIDTIPLNTRFDIRAYLEVDDFGIQFQQCYQFSYSNLNGDIDTFGYGYYGGQSNYSFYSKVQCRGHDGNDTYYTPMDNSYKFDDMYETMNIDYQSIDFNYEYGQFYIDVYFYLLPVNYFNEYFSGVSTNYSDGYNTGYSEGYTTGKDEGLSEGYTEGYQTAKDIYLNEDAHINSIFSGIVTIGLIPIEFLMSVFNFEILGINFSHVISAILSVMIVVILLRIVFSGKASNK